MRLGRGYPNKTFTSRGKLADVLADITGESTAAATTDTISAHVSGVAGATTAASVCTASQSQTAVVNGVATLTAHNAFEREDLAVVNGASAAAGLVLAPFFRPEQRVSRAPAGRF